MISFPTRILALIPLVTGIVASGLVLGLAESRYPEGVSADPAWADMSCGSDDVRLLGFSDALNKTAFGGFPVSELSGLSYDRQAERFTAVADRAGAVQTHAFDIEIDVENLAVDAPEVAHVTVLKNGSGVPYNGFTFDAEGVVVDHRTDTVLVASESGSAVGEQPEFRRFSRDGDEVESLTVPQRFLIGTNNVSFESLSVSPNGKSLFTAMERHLPADGATADFRSRVRILQYEDLGDGFEAVREYFYLTEPGRTAPDLGVAEVLALSERSLLVLERGFIPTEGNTIRVFLASLKDAEDVSGVPSLASGGQPVEKRLVFDLANCPEADAPIAPGAVQVHALHENFEAMTFGPDLSGNRQALVLVSDDNGSATQHTRVVALSVAADLGEWD